jgi:hypothetical protein
MAAGRFRVEKNMILRYAILIFLLASCKSPQLITERIYTDTTIIKETERLVTIPGQTIQSPGINIDSLSALFRSGTPIQTINRNLYYQDPETKLRVGLLIDQLGNLTALCEQQDNTISMMDKEIQRLQKQTITVVEKPTFWDKFSWGLLGAAFGVILSQVAMIFLRK